MHGLSHKEAPKFGILSPIQEAGSHTDRPLALPHYVGFEFTTPRGDYLETKLLEHRVLSESIIKH